MGAAVERFRKCLHPRSVSFPINPQCLVSPPAAELAALTHSGELRLLVGQAEAGQAEDERGRQGQNCSRTKGEMGKSQGRQEELSFPWGRIVLAQLVPVYCCNWCRLLLGSRKTQLFHEPKEFNRGVAAIGYGKLSVCNDWRGRVGEPVAWIQVGGVLQHVS